MPEVQLSPPWYTFANEIKYTYGLSNYILVNDLIQDDEEYILVINVCDTAIAQALRQILPLSKNVGAVVKIVIFNGLGQEVQVSNEAYTPEELAILFCTALKGNPLFIGTVLTDGLVPPMVKGTVGDVVIIIEKCIVQFFNDDIGELCSNFNEVASKVFTEVSNLDYNLDLKISFSTYDSNCKLQKNLYCCK